jgi:hypothetical protein
MTCCTATSAVTPSTPATRTRPLLARTLDEALRLVAADPGACIHLLLRAWPQVDRARAHLAGTRWADRIHVHHHSAGAALRRILRSG